MGKRMNQWTDSTEEQAGQCIICPEIISKPSRCETKASNSKFEEDIKSFYDLFSLPPNYFQAHLQVFSVPLHKIVCHQCRKKIELISRTVKEIDKLKKQLDELKVSVKNELTRVTVSQVEESDTTELDQSNFELARRQIRKELQQKIQVSRQSVTNSYAELESVVDQIDTDLFFGLASPVNSNFAESEDDVFNKRDENDKRIDTDEIKQEVKAESIWNENQADDDPDFINNDQEQSESSDSDTKPPVPKQAKRIRKTFLKSRPRKLTPSELRLVQDANLKQCSVTVTRLNAPAPTLKLKKRRRSLKTDFRCNHCDRVFSTGRLLLRHRSRGHPETFPFICTDCNRGFHQETTLQRHQQVHDKNHKFYCQTCNAEFENREGLREHRKIHPWIRPRKVCARCGNSFATASKLLHHERKHHGVPYPFICSFCTRGYNSKKELEVHEANHTGEQTFQCDKCPTQFASQFALDRHIKWKHVRHTGETVTCPVCSRTYSTKGSMMRHMKTHTGERPFVCDVCSMSFVFKDKLEKHQSIHTKERPYLCQECGFSCRLKGLLRAHEKVHEMHRKLRENIQKEAGSNDLNIEIMKRLPVPRLAKPRNRSLRFPKINPPTLIVDSFPQTKPEMNCITVPEVEPEPELEPEPESESVGKIETDNSIVPEIQWSC